MDFCFGFGNELAYPRSLEIYNPKTVTTQHELDLNPYMDNPDYQVQLDYNSTSATGELAYYGSVLVNKKIAVIENNQTVGWEWISEICQNFDVADLNANVLYWNTTQTSTWTNIRQDHNFDQAAFSFQGMEMWYLANATVEKNKEYYMRMWLTIVPTLDDHTHEFFVAIKPRGETLESAVLGNRFHYLDPWYNAAWQYRKSHIITSASGAGTNYQMKITVHYSSGTDSGEHVYLNSKCELDFGDIRFTDDDQTTLLDHWMEEKVNGDYAAFWVEVQDDLSSSDATIYVYYGNSEATTTSDGDDTFTEFEDFTGISQSMTIYNSDTSKIEITHDTTNDRLQCEWKTPSSAGYQSAHAYWGTVSSGHAMRMKYYRGTPSDLTANKHYSMCFQEDYAESYPPTTNDDMAGHCVWSATGTYPPSRAYDWSLNSGNNQNSGIYSISLDTWNIYEVTWATSNVSTYWNNTYQWSPSSTTYVPNENLYPLVGGARGSMSTSSSSFAYWDWILVRKFVDPEPTHGVWGEEETSQYIAMEYGYLAQPGVPLGEQGNESWICDQIFSYFEGDSVWGGTNAYWNYTTQDDVNDVLQWENNASNFVGYATNWWVGDYRYSILSGTKHYGCYGDSGDDIWDYQLYNYTNYLYWEDPSPWWEPVTNRQYFNFIWTCVNGGLQWNDTIGTPYNVTGITWFDGNSSENMPDYTPTNPFDKYGYYEDPTSTPETVVGLPLAWTGTLDMSIDGYADPDSGDYCYIGFENISPFMINTTGYQGKTYKEFPYYFYRYALGIDGGPTHHTINDSLDYAAYMIFGPGYSFSNSKLCTGEWKYWYFGGDPQYDGWWYCRMRVFGNGDMIIPG